MGDRDAVFEEDVEMFVIGFFDQWVKIFGELVGRRVIQTVFQHFQYFRKKEGFLLQGCDFYAWAGFFGRHFFLGFIRSIVSAIVHIRHVCRSYRIVPAMCAWIFFEALGGGRRIFSAEFIQQYKNRSVLSSRRLAVEN